MARIVSKSRAGENGAKPRDLAGLPRANYSAFWRRGETRSCLEIAHIQQFRVYILDRTTCNFRIPRAGRSLARRFGGPRAIVVLVERGGAMIATRPDDGIFAPHERIRT